MSKQHPTFTRLMAAAAALPTPITGPSALGMAIGAAPQTVTNWAARGVSNPGATMAQSALQISATWVLEGKGPMFIGGDPPPSSAGAPAGGKPAGADAGIQKTVLDPKLLATAISLAQRVFQQAGRVPNVEQLAAASTYAYAVLLRGVGMKAAEREVNDMFARNGIIHIEEDSIA